MPFSDKSNSRFNLFSMLAEADSPIVSSSTLTEKLGVSRQAVFKLVLALREEGLEIESIPQKGYMLKSFRESDALSPTLIDYLLREDKIFSKCLYIHQVDSTQQVLKKLAVQDAPEGIIAITEHQTRGRGRQGRDWASPPGRNLYFSILLRPKLAPGEVQLLNLAAGLAVRAALSEEYGVRAELKWPNDVLAGEKKICGILSETAGEPDRVYYAVTGIGVNTNLPREDMSAEIVGTATSVLLETGKLTPRPLLLSQIFTRLSALLEVLTGDNGKQKLLATYRENCATLGKKVRVIEDANEFIGIAEDVTDQGAIIVNIGGEKKIFAAVDVQHLRLI